MMRTSLSLATISSAIALGLIACSSTGGGNGTSGTAGSCSLTEVDTGESPSCPSLCAVSNEAFCGESTAQPDCNALTPGAAIDVCGVPLRAPQSGGANLELTRSSGVDEYAGSGPPQLDCFSPSAYPAAPGTPQTTTMTGIAKIFSHGCQSKELDISVYTVKRTDGSDDGEPDQLIGSTITTASDCTIDGVAEEEEDCGTRYECVYSYPDVPTETELMILTQGTLWSPIYEYGIFIPNAEVSDGSWSHDVRALATDDYSVIAQVAMGKTITPGYGAVAGEVHDCGDVRLVNAVVDINRSKFITTYFTDDEANPLPDLSAKATSTLGLYAAMDGAPGPVTIAAAGIADGQLLGAGFMRARIFPDAVTSVTFRGLRPFQLPDQP